ncbi:MAG: hypothetical protein IJK68_08045 [Muribaculaceae bacterium]|nr:hypothetical protein [Muribaculaceae bacterium]MBR0024473.1 hypothetical protein [Muribaculaceae bacterium]
MENDNNMNELEQMREQMEAFKSRLDKQQIVNEQLVRNSMGSKMSWIKNFVWAEIIMVPILLIIMAGFHASEGLSWWLFAFLAAGLIADATGDFIINRIPKSQLLSGDLVATSKRLAQMKKQRTTWFIAGMIFVTIWLVWFIIEVVLKLDNGCKLPDHSTVVAIMVAGIAVGALIGGVVAWLIFRKMQKTNNQLIEQINQIIHEE